MKHKHLCTIDFTLETEYDMAHMAVHYDNKAVVKALMDRVAELVSDVDTFHDSLKVHRTETEDGDVETFGCYLCYEADYCDPPKVTA